MEQGDNEISASINDTVTQKLAKIESSGELQGMAELYDSLRKRPLNIKAYPNDAPDIPTTSGANVKTVHFIRHGQGFHNLTADQFTSEGRVWEAFSQSPDNPYVMPELMDAPLTQKGRDQARSLQTRVGHLKEFGDSLASGNARPELIVSSTLCRALQTASIACDNLLVGEGNNELAVPCIAHEMAREASGVHVCDKRRPISQQRREFPWFDFGGVKSDGDTLFNQELRETKAEVGERIYDFMMWLSKREETNLVVVSHSCWLLTVFNGVVECDDLLKPWFGTGEMRSVKLVFTNNK